MASASRTTSRCAEARATAVAALVVFALHRRLTSRPPPQQGAKLLHVSDLLLLGRATIEESLLLLHWLGRAGHERLGE